MWLSMLDFGSLFGHVPTERLDPGLREWTNVITLVYSCCHCPTMASFNLFDIYVTICSAAVIHAANCSVVETFFFYYVCYINCSTVVSFFIIISLYQLFCCSWLLFWCTSRLVVTSFDIPVVSFVLLWHFSVMSAISIILLWRHLLCSQGHTTCYNVLHPI